MYYILQMASLQLTQPMIKIKLLLLKSDVSIIFHSLNTLFLGWLYLVDKALHKVKSLNYVNWIAVHFTDTLA